MSSLSRWTIVIGAGLLGGLAARANLVLGFLIFGVGVAIAWRE